MQRLIFPFWGKYPKLNQFWWHRFVLVTFFIIIPTIFFGLIVEENRAFSKKQQTCIRAYDFLLYPHPPGVKVADYSKAIEPCYGPSYSAHPDTKIFAAVVAIIASYLLQLVYYKVVLYVVLGKNLPK